MKRHQRDKPNPEGEERTQKTIARQKKKKTEDISNDNTWFYDHVQDESNETFTIHIQTDEGPFVFLNIRVYKLLSIVYIDRKDRDCLEIQIKKTLDLGFEKIFLNLPNELVTQKVSINENPELNLESWVCPKKFFNVKVSVSKIEFINIQVYKEITENVPQNSLDQLSIDTCKCVKEAMIYTREFVLPHTPFLNQNYLTLSQMNSAQPPVIAQLQNQMTQEDIEAFAEKPEDLVFQQETDEVIMESSQETPPNELCSDRTDMTPEQLILQSAQESVLKAIQKVQRRTQNLSKAKIEELNRLLQVSQTESQSSRESHTQCFTAIEEVDSQLSTLEAQLADCLNRSSSLKALEADLKQCSDNLQKSQQETQQHAQKNKSLEEKMTKYQEQIKNHMKNASTLQLKIKEQEAKIKEQEDKLRDTSTTFCMVCYKA